MADAEYKKDEILEYINIFSNKGEMLVLIAKDKIQAMLRHFIKDLYKEK